jgi:hypothetical protein
LGWYQSHYRRIRRGYFASSKVCNQAPQT